MKNVLARGGIEFLAVLLGISGSLWIDDYSEKKELDKQVFASLHALKDELKANETLFENSLSNIEVMLPSFKKMLNPSMLTNLSFDELDKIKHHTGTPWSITIRSRVFNSMEASGLLYKIEDRDLMDKVLKHYRQAPFLHIGEIRLYSFSFYIKSQVYHHVFDLGLVDPNF